MNGREGEVSRLNFSFTQYLILFYFVASIDGLFCGFNWRIILWLQLAVFLKLVIDNTEAFGGGERLFDAFSFGYV